MDRENLVMTVTFAGHEWTIKLRKEKYIYIPICVKGQVLYIYLLIK